MSYFEAMVAAMSWISQQEKTVFLGQAVGVPGTFMFNTLKDVPNTKRVELPVCESFQMQLSLGLAFTGCLPISIYPRLNFLSLALGDMINTVDKINPIMAPHKAPKVIIRSAIGPDTPVHPGHQHIGDYTEAFKKLFSNLIVVKLEEAEDILPCYQKAYSDKDHSYLIIEVGNNYASK